MISIDHFGANVGIGAGVEVVHCGRESVLPKGVLRNVLPSLSKSSYLARFPIWLLRQLRSLASLNVVAIHVASRRVVRLLGRVKVSASRG